ncbi:MAG: hypothetical protein GTO24_23160 [candidate division Zixibacteria bacterium]|nr:hypothetical protein [candidate division Zixibacteria bacterium]
MRSHALFALLLIFACWGVTPGSADPLTGSYIFIDKELEEAGYPAEIKLVLKKDGRFEFWSAPDGYPLESTRKMVRVVKGKYSISNGRIMLSFDGRRQELKYRIDGNTLILINEQLGTLSRFKRVGT